MIISADGIRSMTGLDDVTVLDETDSTNTRLKALAHEKDEGAVLIAKRQTAGRGRRGKTFFSPEGGLYASVLLKPRDRALAARLTMMAGVAAAETVEQIAHKRARIKWVNDIFVDGKKVCGILAETDAQGGCAVVGAGFNLLTPKGGFDESIARTAGALFDKEPVNATLAAAEFLNRFFTFYREERPFFEAYRERSLLLGRDVTFVQNGTLYSGIARDIRADGALLVSVEGKSVALSSGEISLVSYGQPG